MVEKGGFMCTSLTDDSIKDLENVLFSLDKIRLKTPSSVAKFSVNVVDKCSSVLHNPGEEKRKEKLVQIVLLD